MLVVDVTFRLEQDLGCAGEAEFTCPDSRTIVMHITEGEGTGTVVETHATPLGLGPDDHPRTMVTEATIAYSIGPASKSHAGYPHCTPWHPAHGPEALGGRPRIRRTPLRAAPARRISWLRRQVEFWPISLNDGPRTVKVRWLNPPHRFHSDRSATSARFVAIRLALLTAFSTSTAASVQSSSGEVSQAVYQARHADS